MPYTQPEIRRLHIEDYQWERTSPSWKLLEPKKNFNHLDENDESILDYCQRVRNIIEVPEDVADQWLYYHYYNKHTVDNYGWLNYYQAKFEKVTIATDEAVGLRVIESYSHYVDSRMQGAPFLDFMCIPRDKEYWIQERTWRTPPIIMDVKSFSHPPPYADISGNYQLVEGHSRLGYLLAMHCAGEPLKDQHIVYVLKHRKDV